MRARAGLSIRAYAAKCGVSDRTVKDWGLNDWLVKHPDGSIDPNASDAKRALNASAIRGGKRVKGQKVRRDELDIPAVDPGDLTDPDVVALSQQSIAALERLLLAARVRKTEAEADKAEMDRDLARGSSLRAADLEPVWREILIVIRQQVMNYGARYASELVAIALGNADHTDEAERQVRAVLDEAGRQVLSEVPDEFKRRMG